MVDRIQCIVGTSIVAIDSKTKDINSTIHVVNMVNFGWSVIDRGWVGLKNNGLLTLSLAIWVRTSPLRV